MDTGGPERGRTGAESSSRAEPLADDSSPVSAIEPTGEDLQISARLLLYIAELPRLGPMEATPESLTQTGMANALGTSRGSVSNALTRLVDGGALEVRLSYTSRLQRRKIYQLTPLGEHLLRLIQDSIARHKGESRPAHGGQVGDTESPKQPS